MSVASLIEETGAGSEVMAKIDEIVSLYPHLYHMATAGSWPSIKQHGLVCTRLACEMASVDEPLKTKLISELRPDSVAIGGASGPKFVVRDQKPMNATTLAKALQDMTASEWLLSLNSKVFFWPTKKRLKTMMGARPYKNVAHDVLVLDTAKLLKAELDKVWLSPMNSGATIPFSHPRGSGTFQRVDNFDLAARLAMAGRNSAIAEVCVDERVDVGPHIIKVVTTNLASLDTDVE